MTRAWTSDLSRRPSGRQRQHARALRRNLTEPEKKLRWHLRQRFPPTLSHFRRQVPVGPYIADFCCLTSKLIIEVDGDQHGFEAHAAHDERRTSYLNDQGFQVIRFANREVMTAIENVLDTIVAELSAGSLPLAGRD